TARPCTISGDFIPVPFLRSFYFQVDFVGMLSPSEIWDAILNTFPTSGRHGRLFSLLEASHSQAGIRDMNIRTTNYLVWLAHTTGKELSSEGPDGITRKLHQCNTCESANCGQNLYGGPTWGVPHCGCYMVLQESPDIIASTEDHGKASIADDGVVSD